MRLLQVFFALDQNRRGWLRRERNRRRRFRPIAAIAECFRGEFDQLCMRDISRRRDDQIARRVVVRMKLHRGFVIEKRNGFRRSFDRPAQRMIGKIRGVE